MTEPLWSFELKNAGKEWYGAPDMSGAPLTDGAGKTGAAVPLETAAPVYLIPES